MLFVTLADSFLRACFKASGLVNSIPFTKTMLMTFLVVVLISVSAAENKRNRNGDCGNSGNNATNYKWQPRYRSMWHRNFCYRLAFACVFRHIVVLVLYFFRCFFDVLFFRNFIHFIHFLFSFKVKNKKCDNRSRRTEKRRLQLSPNKN